jgi:hypothetical protein
MPTIDPRAIEADLAKLRREWAARSMSPLFIVLLRPEFVDQVLAWRKLYAHEWRGTAVLGSADLPKMQGAAGAQISVCTTPAPWDGPPVIAAGRRLGAAGAMALDGAPEGGNAEPVDEEPKRRHL